jgi:hypothetical protein
MSVLSDKLNLIWYGDFEDHQTDPCKSFPLADHSAIKRVYRTDNNVWPTYRKGAANNPFDTLECGYAYIIELEASSSVDVPHANVSPGNSSDPRGLLVAEVDLSTPTPSPTPVATPSPTPVTTQECFPGDYEKVTAANVGPATVGGLGTGTFAKAGTFGYKSSDFQTPGTAAQFFINIPGDLPLALFVSSSTFPAVGAEPDVRFETSDNGNCYGGKLIKNPEDDNWTANLELLFTGEVPTPSPTPAPSVCGKPDNNKFASFNFSDALKEASQTPGFTSLIDRGDEAFQENLGVSLGQFQYLKLNYRDSFATKFGGTPDAIGVEGNYVRLLDPTSGQNYNGIGRDAHHAFFEDQLPLPTGDPMSLVGAGGSSPFTIEKFILDDEDVFLTINGKCYKGTMFNDEDQLESSELDGFGLKLIIFREV